MRTKLNSAMGRLISVVLFLLLTLSAAYPADIWYEDNNMGKAAGMPTDFHDKFYSPATWENARQHIKVYLVRANIFEKQENNLSDAFLKEHFIPILNNSGIKLALDVGGATWMQRGERNKIMHQELKLIERLEKLGIRVSHVSFQSVLSKKLFLEGKRQKDPDSVEILYSIEQRIADIVVYTAELKKRFPYIKVGIIDALPSHGKDYKAPYLRLAKAFRDNNMELSFIHLDLPYELVKEKRHNLSWNKVKEVELFVKNEVASQFGLFCTSKKGGNTSDKAFHEGVISVLKEYTYYGGNPDHYIIASWFPYPNHTIPENAIGDDYPAMRTVLEFGRQLQIIERDGFLHKEKINIPSKKRAVGKQPVKEF